MSCGLKVIALALPCVLGHGTMSFPPTRNTVNSHSCPQCANGVGVCGSGGGWGADGTGASALDSSYTTPLTQLVAGGMVEIEAYFTAPHKGHFAVELCAHPGPVIQESCFQRLERDSSDTRYGPYVAAKPWMFVLPDNSCQSACSASAPLKARFKVPNDISEHAVLRWYWQSGNSCDSAPECGVHPDSAVSAWSGNINGKTCRAALGTVGIACGGDCPSLQCNGEQFRTCADVKITSGASGTIVTSSGSQSGSGGSGSNGGGSDGWGSGSNSGGSGGWGSGSNGGGSGGLGGSGGGSAAGCTCSPDKATECRANLKPMMQSMDYINYCNGLCDYYAYYFSGVCAGYTSASKCAAAMSSGFCTSSCNC